MGDGILEEFSIPGKLFTDRCWWSLMCGGKVFLTIFFSPNPDESVGYGTIAITPCFASSLKHRALLFLLILIWPFNFGIGNFNRWFCQDICKPVGDFNLNCTEFMYWLYLFKSYLIYHMLKWLQLVLIIQLPCIKLKKNNQPSIIKNKRQTQTTERKICIYPSFEEDKNL